MLTQHRPHTLIPQQRLPVLLKVEDVFSVWHTWGFVCLTYLGIRLFDILGICNVWSRSPCRSNKLNEAQQESAYGSTCTQVAVTCLRSLLTAWHNVAARDCDRRKACCYVKLWNQDIEGQRTDHWPLTTGHQLSAHASASVASTCTSSIKWPRVFNTLFFDLFHAVFKHYIRKPFILLLSIQQMHIIAWSPTIGGQLIIHHFLLLLLLLFFISIWPPFLTLTFYGQPQNHKCRELQKNEERWIFQLKPLNKHNTVITNYVTTYPFSRNERNVTWNQRYVMWTRWDQIS